MDIFEPVSRETLVALDPAARTFVFQLQHAMTHLTQSTFGEWTLEMLNDDERRRWIAMTLRHPALGRMRLELLPASTPGEGLVRHSDFAMRCASADPMPSELLNEGIRMVVHSLNARLGGEIIHLPTITPAAPQRAVLGRKSEVPSAIQARLKRLVGVEHFANWRLHDATPTTDRPGARLTFTGPGDDCANLVLSVSPEQRVQVAWHWPVYPHDATRSIARRAMTLAVGRALSRGGAREKTRR